MKLFPLLILAVSLVAFAGLADAQLDDTLAQCEARYGKSTEQWNDEEVPDAKCYLFEKEGVEIEVTVLYEHVAAIAFSKVDNAEFSETEIQSLLDANKGTSSWGTPEPEKKPSADGKPEVWWDRADNGASASYWYDDEGKQRTLDMETAAYSQAQDAAETKKKRKGGKH